MAYLVKVSASTALTDACDSIFNLITSEISMLECGRHLWLRLLVVYNSVMKRQVKVATYRWREEAPSTARQSAMDMSGQDQGKNDLWC